MCQNRSVAEKGNVRKLGVEARNCVLWRVQCCDYALWYQWVQWIILRNLINLHVEDYEICFKKHKFVFPMCVIVCFGKGQYRNVERAINILLKM